MLHDKQAGLGQVVDIDELASRPAAAPNGNYLIAPQFRFVEATDQGGDDVRIFRAEIVARSEGVGGNPHQEFVAILLPVGLAEFHAGQLGDGIGLVGRLQGTRQEICFLHGLPAKPRITTGTGEIQ